MLYFPAILYPPDGNGVSGCVVPDLLVNASGASPDAALRDAAEIVTELLEGMARKGEAFPDATPAEDVDAEGGTLVLLATPLRRSAA